MSQKRQVHEEETETLTKTNEKEEKSKETEKQPDQGRCVRSDKEDEHEEKQSDVKNNLRTRLRLFNTWSYTFQLAALKQRDKIYFAPH